MNGREAMRVALSSTQSILDMYVADLTDAELFVRPVPQANHVAWQLGHLIAGDPFMVKSEFPDAKFPELPVGFNDTYGTEGSKKNGPDGFMTKAEYLKLFGQVRAASIEALERLTDADLDRKCTGAMASFCPMIADLFQMIANHTLMHAGQFTVLRRALGKPVLF
jgi:DinB superfamily